MPKMTIRIILKSGAEFAVKCDEFTLNRNGFEQVTGYDIKGITENKPVYVNFEQVAAIVRVIADEQPEAETTPEEETTPEAKKHDPTETPTKCPFCEGENENARIYADTVNKEYFVYCPVCGIETINTYTSKAGALKAFSEGKNKGITEPKEPTCGDTVQFTCNCGQMFEKPEGECKTNVPNCYGTYFAWADCPSCGKTCQAVRNEGKR